MNIIPYITYQNFRISSSHIRKLIYKAIFDEIALYLGYDFFISGKCVLGNQLGRSIGYPTINLKWSEGKILPSYGTYYSVVEINHIIYTGMAFIGEKLIGNQGVNQNKVYLEVHLFDCNQNFYGENVKIFFKEKIRNNISFNNLEDLKNQLNIDKRHIKKIIALKTKNV